MTPYHESRDVTLYHGDVRAVLAELPAHSVQAVVTSPPYYLMRSYRVTHPEVWGGRCPHPHEHAWGDEQPGDPRAGSGTQTNKNGRGEDYGRGAPRGNFCEHVCEHEWLDTSRLLTDWEDTRTEGKQATNKGANQRHQRIGGETCGKCHAWRGTLGSEPTPEMFVENIAEVFRAVARVLRPDGVVWLNLGDSMATHASGGPNSAHNFRAAAVAEAEGIGTLDKPTAASMGLKEKDAMLIPFRVVMRLQQDGWYVRGQPIPWIKRSAMTESAGDRPGNALEWVFLLSRQRRYYYDGQIIRRPAKSSTPARYAQGFSSDYYAKSGVPEYHGKPGFITNPGPGDTRSFRNSDGYFDTLDDEIVWTRERLNYLYGLRENGGIYADDAGAMLAIDITATGFKGSHFATFPETLVQPMIRAATPEVGACGACGAPWRRVLEPGPEYAEIIGKAWNDHKDDYELGNRKAPDRRASVAADYRTIAWEPSCKCSKGCADCAARADETSTACFLHRPVPATVLDPFAGTATVALACRLLNRRSVGIDISTEYLDMAVKRLSVRQDTPMPLVLS